MSTRSYLLARIDAKTLQRAEKYVRDGHILSINHDADDEYSAQVRGSNGQVYSVELCLDAGPEGPLGRITDTFCTCPMAYMCKHAIACYIYLNGQGAGLTRHGSQALRAPRQQIVAAKRAQMSPGTWLKQAIKAMGPKDQPAEHEQHPTYRDASKQRILFALSLCKLPTGRLAPRLLLHRGSLLTNGSYGRMTFLRDVPAKLVTKLDEIALRCLARASDDEPYDYELIGTPDLAVAGQIQLMMQGPGAARALEAVAATGRLYLHDVHGPVLNLVPPRWGKLMWSWDSEMAQKLALVLEPPAQFQFIEDVPYFIDPETCSLGRIITDVHPDLLQHLAHAPAVGPEEAAAFAKSIPPELAAQLPAPEVLPIRDLAVAPEVRVSVSEAVDGRGQNQLLGDLRFSYDGVDVAATSDSKVVYRKDAHGITRIKRQRNKEQAAHKRLTRATQVKQLKGAQTILLGPSADKQAYFDVAQKVLAPLQADGWQVDGAFGPMGQVTQVDDNPDAAMQESKLNGWFELDMGIMVNNKRVTLPPLLLRLIKDPSWGINTAAIKASGRKKVFVPINDEEVVSMPTDRIIDLLAMLESLGELAEISGDKVRVPMGDAHLLLDLQRRDKLNLRAPEGLARLAEILRVGAKIPAIAPPAGLNAELRGYQVDGVSWLQMLRANSLGGVLADDMGLGKTLQALTHILVEKQAGRLAQKALIVCPTSVLGTWVESCARFTPELTLTVHHGAQRGYSSRDEFDVLVTTFGTLLRDADILSEKPWSVYVLDEAQMVKNALSKSYIAACRVTADQHIALTGTPLENGLRELWAVVNWAMPGLLSTRQKFETQFVKPIEIGADVSRRGALVSRLRPFLMRRTKAQVMQELPEKTEIIEHIELGQKQRDLYEVVRASLDKKVRESIASQGMSRSMLTVLDALLKLRQVCCDPRLVKNVKIPKNCGTAKLERLFDILPDLIDAGRRVLIFSQFTSMLELIEVELDARQIKYCKLTGQTRKRDEVVETFRGGSAPVFLISLKAGGTGLNLPEADTVIHYDPWWNPAVEDQATSRVHRMGQKKAVFVYKMVVEGSVESKILQLQQHKRSLFAALLEGKELGGKLTEKDIDSLFAPLA